MTLLQQGLSADLQDYIPSLIDTGTTILTFIIVFLIAYQVGRFASVRAVTKALERRGFDETLIGFAKNLTALVTTVFAVAFAATIAGFGTVLAAFATLGGAITLAVGFASQNLVANFVSGVFIIQDKPFVVGDWIEWDGNEGVVREIQMRVTKLDTFDNELVTVPNSDLANAAVVNNVANDRRRVAVGFGIGYEDDIDHAREAIIEEADRVEGALAEPEPEVLVTQLGDSAVVLSGRLWIDPSETGYRPIRARFVERVKKRFDAEDIDMPYPNTELSGDVAVTNVPSEIES
jgi:small-conductance mechanosensitive channel